VAATKGVSRICMSASHRMALRATKGDDSGAKRFVAHAPGAPARALLPALLASGRSLKGSAGGVRRGSTLDSRRRGQSVRGDCQQSGSEG
jgi:hypothetical protein